MKRKTFVFLLVLPIIAACTSNPTVVPTSIPSTDIPALVTNVSLSPTPSSTGKCDEVKSGNLDELKSVGTIVLEDIHEINGYTINANLFTKNKLYKEDEYISSIAVSPDRKWTAYELRQINNHSANLVIMDSLGSSQLIIPWEEDWSYIPSWLDDQRLLINVDDGSSDGHPEFAAKELSTFLVVNPFTGERKLLQPDFPNIYSHFMIPVWSGFGSTVYNSTLDRVVYLRADSADADFHFVLWDMDKQRSLVDFGVVIGSRVIPRWSPDGEKVAMVPTLIRSDIREAWPADDLYIVNRDGVLEKITDLSNYYPWFYIGEFSWSPDGKNIAFWLSTWTERPKTYGDLIADQYLAIVNTKNNDLSVYCISGMPHGLGRVAPPVWSPDGQQLLVESPLPDEHSEVVFFDLNRRVIATIGQDMIPVGWMVGP